VTLEGQVELAAPPAAVWALLEDPARVARLLPGVEQVEPAGADRYRVRVRYALGPVSGTYTGTVELAERQAPRALRLKVSLRGTPGFVEGDGGIELAPHGNGTRARYRGQFRLGGMLAAVGQRMAVPAARKTIEEFFRAVAAELSRAQ